MTPPSPHDPKPVQPSPGDPLLKGVNLGGLFSLGMTDEFEQGQTIRASGQPWSAPAAEEVAQLFPGYEVKRLIGRGGMGAVYEARQLDLDRRVAIKLLPHEITLDEAFVQRFQREARALARLQHPGIVAVHQSGTARDGRLYFVMEHVDGTTLYDLIHGGQLTVTQALEIVKQVCEALAYAHEEGVIHRDIKPANILVDKRGRVKIADFGLAKLARTSTTEAASLMHTQTGHIMGTPDYAAPEQMRRGAEVDHRADIYSLGVTLYEMLTGQIPRGLFVPPSEKAGTDQRLDKVVLRALHENPERRYQQATHMRDEVTRTQASGLRGSDAPRGAQPQKRSSLGVKITLTALALFLLLGGGFITWKLLNPTNPTPSISSRLGTASPSTTPTTTQEPKPAPTSKPASTSSSSPAAPVSAPASPPPISREAVFQGKRYLLSAQPMTWTKSHDAARASGGNLASATSRERNAWLTQTFAKEAAGGLFLGGQCWMPGGVWEWDAGDKWSFQAWPGEAPIYGALILQQDGTWKAGTFEEERLFLIELPQ